MKPPYQIPPNKLLTEKELKKLEENSSPVLELI